MVRIQVVHSDLELAGDLQGSDDVPEILESCVPDELTHLREALREELPPLRVPFAVRLLLFSGERLRKHRITGQALPVVLQRSDRDLVLRRGFRVTDVDRVQQDPDSALAVELRGCHDETQG